MNGRDLALGLAAGLAVAGLLPQGPAGRAAGSAAMSSRSRVVSIVDGVTFVFKGGRYGPNSVEAFVPDVDDPARTYAIGACRAVYFDEEGEPERGAEMYARCMVDVAKLRKRVGSEGAIWVVTRADLESEQYMRRGYGRKMYETLIDETARISQDDVYFVPHACRRDGSTSVDADRVWMSLKRDHVYVGRAVSNVRSTHSWGSNVPLADRA